MGSSGTERCWEPGAAHGWGGAGSAAMEAAPGPEESGVQSAALAAAAAAGSADDGKSLEVASEAGSADVLLENEVAMENMKL